MCIFILMEASGPQVGHLHDKKTTHSEMKIILTYPLIQKGYLSGHLVGQPTEILTRVHACVHCT